MKGTKIFYSMGLKRTIYLPLAYVFEGQTHILKGVSTPVTCQMLEFCAI